MIAFRVVLKELPIYFSSVEMYYCHTESKKLTRQLFLLRQHRRHPELRIYRAKASLSQNIPYSLDRGDVLPSPIFITLDTFDNSCLYPICRSAFVLSTLKLCFSRGPESNWSSFF